MATVQQVFAFRRHKHHTSFFHISCQSIFRKLRDLSNVSSFKMIAALCIVFVINFCLSDGLSGLYYDNGIDQTVIHTYLNNREKKEMQNEILHVLGLDHRPRPVSTLPDLKRTDNDMSSAPRFLKDVYQSLTEEDTGDLKLTTDVLANEFNVSYSDVDSMNQADVIMSFVNHGHHLHSIRHHHGDGRFWFDLSEIPELMSVISAELRVYLNFTHPDGEDEPLVSPVENALIIAYKIGSGDRLIYADSKEVTVHQQGWISFNVSLVLVDWLSNPETNYGIQLVFISDSGRKVSSREAGVVGSYGDAKLQPFMVAFFRAQLPALNQQRAASSVASSTIKRIKDDESVRDLIKKRIRRQAANSKKKGKGSDDAGSWNSYVDLDARLSRRSCQKKNLYVSFRDLGWQDWIIAPDGYAAFYCNGECSFPLNAHMNASNHAIVQTLVHLMNPYRVPKPCCAPIKLSSISVLYFDDNSNVILKKYRNMVVKSCGCH